MYGRIFINICVAFPCDKWRMEVKQWKQLLAGI